ncbi:MAG TPA: hypothetical protein VIQ24_17265 [Pyrinomonadaceae bacterium]
MRVIMSVLALLLLATEPPSHAQKQFTNLDRVAEAIERDIQDKMPDWTHKTVPPATVDENTASDKVIIQQWTFGRKNVRVAVLQHQSEAEATSVLRQFAADKKSSNSLNGLGDEAYLWGLRNSIAFRQGNLTIYMSAVVSEKLNDAEAVRNPAEAMRKAAQAEHDEETKVTRGFAQHVAAVLKTL